MDARANIMKTFSNLLISLIIAAWIIAIAVFSIQNVTPVSLKFLTYQSIEIPMGVVLAFSVGVGVMGGAIAPLFLPRSSRKRASIPPEEEEEEYILESWSENS